MVSFLIKGILIGLLFGLPIGAVGAMTIQRSFSLGFKAGLITGLGSSVADCLYAIVGAFGITLISDFLLQNKTYINFFGGVFIFLMGLRLMFKKEESVITQTKTMSTVKIFLSSFIIGITNPTVILTFLFAFTYFGITGAINAFDSISLVIGVFIGTYVWWIALSGVTSAIKKKVNGRSFRYINRVFGGVLTVFSAVIFLQIFI